MRIQLVSRRPRASSAPPVPPAFSPPDLAGLALWLDASTLALADGAPVVTWPDASGHGRNAITTDGPPLFRAAQSNGLPAVQFRSSARDRMAFAAGNPMAGASAGTAITVQRCTDPGSGSNGALLFRWGSSGQNDSQPYADGNVYCGWGSTTRPSCGNPLATLAAFRVHTIVSAPGDFRYLLDGVPLYASATNVVGWGSDAGDNAPQLSSYASTWDGDAAEVVCYSRALNATELDQVREYLAAKWL